MVVCTLAFVIVRPLLGLVRIGPASDGKTGGSDAGRGDRGWGVGRLGSGGRPDLVHVLQRRVSAGRRLARQVAEHPAHLVVFDLLADADEELIDRPLQRRARLQRLLDDAPPQLLLCPQTRDVDQAGVWMSEWAEAGIEGLLIKNAAGRYQPGRAGWWKFKTRLTAEAIIGGITGTMF